MARIALVVVPLLLLIAVGVWVKFYRKKGDTLAELGLLHILDNHPLEGLTVAQILVWKQRHLHEDVQKFSSIPSDIKTCERLLERMRARGLVQKSVEHGMPRYISLHTPMKQTL